jgi:hypothetical protein
MATHTAARRSHAQRHAGLPRHARRVSGPIARPVPHVPAIPRPVRRGSTGAFERLLALPDLRLVDRLLRGRVWIWLIGILLGGIVAMQVSLLKLNTGISADLLTSQNLERSNAELRASVSSLDSGQRIEDLAAARGMVMPDDGQLRFLTAGRPGDGARAAQSMTAPDPQAAEQRAQAMLAVAQQREADAAVAAQSAMAQQQQAAATTTAVPPPTTTAQAAPAEPTQ